MFRRWHNAHDPEENDVVRREAKVAELKNAIGPLSGCSLQFCTDACFRRYLEARNWNLDKSKKMLEETLKWRAAFKPEEIRWELSRMVSLFWTKKFLLAKPTWIPHEVANEGETGKVYRANFHDRHGRTVLILRPGKQNTTSHDNQLRHLVYLIENAILNLPDGQEQMVWLIDFTGWSLTNSVPIKTARDTVNILQNHYPERLALAVLYNPPRIFETFWKVVKYFLDTKTFQKVKFVYPKNEESIELMRQNFDIKILPAEFGGKDNSQYDHEEFSNLMAQDDVKAALVWGLDKKLTCTSNGHLAPEPALVTTQSN